MARRQTIRPEGEVRHSQLITTYGPGAMVDLPDCSVVIGGLNFWMYGPDQPPEEIDEPRLIAKLRQSLNVGSLRLRKPPVYDVGPGAQSRPGGDFQESCHSLAAIQAAWIKGSARTGSGSSVGLFIHTSAG
jgi:hypothetical protein